MVRIWPHITGRSLLTGPWNIDFIKVQAPFEDACLLPRVDDNFPSTTCNPDRNLEAVDVSVVFSVEIHLGGQDFRLEQIH